MSCGDARDKVAVRVNQGEAIAALQVLERHSLNQGRFASARLANDVDVRKSIFVLDAEEALIISKINPTNMCDMTVLHRPIVQPWALCARSEILPRSRPSTVVTFAHPQERRPLELLQRNRFVNHHHPSERCRLQDLQGGPAGTRCR